MFSRQIKTNSSRRGFTLIELMIVITIISLLALISLRVYGGIVTGAKVRATQATIKKIQGLLDQRLDAFTRYFARLKVVQGTPEYRNAADPTQYPCTNYDPKTIEILARKQLYRSVFPQTWAETGLTVGQRGDSSPQSNPKYDSAEILYFVLTDPKFNVRILGSAPVGSDAFSTAEVADLDGDGWNEFVDAWGQPLRFYRWPTRLIDSTYTSAANRALYISSVPASGDPDDAINRAASCVTEANGFHNPGIYHTFLVASAGPDLTLGLREPNDSANYGLWGMFFDAASAVDDITNLNSRAGGR